ncbi:MAG TPA: DUF3999 family protein [Bryobacteraceae bacterium]
MLQLRRENRLLACVLGLAALAFADFAASAWQYRKLIKTDARPANSVLIGKDIYFIAREDLADLRIVHGTEEVPYLIVTASPETKEQDVPATMEDRVVTATGVEAVMAFDHPLHHNRLTIDSRISNFRHKVQLYSSENGRTWDLLKKDAYIFDFTADEHHASLLTIDYPTSTRLFLKVVIEGAKDPAILSGATVHLREERPATWQEIAKFDDPRPVEDEKRHTTSYDLDFGAPGAPRDRLSLSITDPAFHRSVSVEWSDDGKDWAADTFSTVYRTEGVESLVVPVGTRRSRYLRVTLFHGDDKPLKLTSVLAEAIARNIVFPSASGGDYYLYFGNPDARQPSYDIAMVLGAATLDHAVTVSAEPREANPAYKAPEPPVKPLSERYPGLLYGVLGIAVVALGYFTLRFMKSVKDSSGNA